MEGEMVWEKERVEDACQDEEGDVSGVKRERKVKRDMGGSRSLVLE